MLGWLILFIVLIVIELITMGLTTIWFAGGALVALLMAFLGLGFAVQMLVFIVVSVLLLVATRPVAVKYFNGDRQKTNAESLIGQQALVLEDIDTLHAAGRVEVNGQEWSARTEEANGFIPKDKVVKIEGIRGVKLIVKAKEDTSC
jgi:membrane protein implicated in regulation of membrane protease activity